MSNFERNLYLVVWSFRSGRESIMGIFGSKQNAEIALGKFYSTITKMYGEIDGNLRIKKIISDFSLGEEEWKFVN